MRTRETNHVVENRGKSPRVQAQLPHSVDGRFTRPREERGGLHDKKKTSSGILAASAFWCTHFEEGFPVERRRGGRWDGQIPKFSFLWMGERESGGRGPCGMRETTWISIPWLGPSPAEMMNHIRSVPVLPRPRPLLKEEERGNRQVVNSVISHFTPFVSLFPRLV